MGDSDGGPGQGLSETSRAMLVEVLVRAQALGVLGPGPVDGHIRHAEDFAVNLEIPPEGPAIDLGSGAGLPGLVLALIWPASRWLLVEARLRRSAVLAQAIITLGLEKRVSVVTGRAEDLGRQDPYRGAHPLVVARCFASPPVTAECSAPFLKVGGHLVVSEPPVVTSEGRWPPDGLALLGLSAGIGKRSRESGYRCFTQSEPCPPAYPRRAAAMKSRPLWRST